MTGLHGRLSEIQEEALWKWRWLGWRESTPAFKLSLAMLSVPCLVLVVLALR